jgi:hypothetical protein
MPSIFLPAGGVIGTSAEDEALDLEILQQAGTQKIVLGVDESFEKQAAQHAFIRMMEGEYIRLLDVVAMAGPGGIKLRRVITITPKGLLHCKELQNKITLRTAIKSKLSN